MRYCPSRPSHKITMSPSRISAAFNSSNVTASLDYSDHHIFRIDDLKDIQKKFEAITAQQKIIVTTEKDAVRLMKFSDELAQLPLYVLPIKHKFLFNEGQQFNDAVINFIKDFKGAEIV